MNADGSGKTRLTGNDPNDGKLSQPASSPDGTKIAFVSPSSYDTYDYEVYVMKADGSGQTRLTKNDGFCPYKCPNRETHIQPTWSPDGKKIAFTRYLPPKTINQASLYDVYVMNADGSGETLVARYIVAGVDWGPVSTGARNPLPAAKITVHPALRLRCMYGSGPAREAAFAGSGCPREGRQRGRVLRQRESASRVHRRRHAALVRVRGLPGDDAEDAYLDGESRRLGHRRRVRDVLGADQEARRPLLR